MKKTSSAKARDKRNKRIEKIYQKQRESYANPSLLFSDIADEVGCAPNTVRNVLIASGLYIPQI